MNNNLIDFKELPVEVNQVNVKSPYKFKIHKKIIKELKPEEVLVKIKASGICGSDLHTVKSGAEDFVPVGHEISGIVVNKDPSVSKFNIGDTVIAENSTICGICDNCKDGMPIYCKNVRTYIGIEAGFADYIVLHYSMLHLFNNLTFEEAVLAEPLTVALDLLKSTDIQINHNVAVFGTGTIAFLLVQILKFAGVKSLAQIGSGVNVKRDNFKKSLSEKLGVNNYFLYNDNTFIQRIEKIYPEGLDRVLITSPPNTFVESVKIAKFGAILGLIGISLDEKRMVTFDMNEFHFKRLQLRAVHPFPNLLFPQSLKLIESGRINAKDLITHKIPLLEYKEAFDIFKKESNVIKVILTD